MCSCWYFLRKGHCPHAYYIQERLAIRTFTEIPLPSAAHAPASFKDDGDASSVEAAGRVRKRHPKRRRPQYKRRPVLPVVGDEKEAHVLPLPKQAARCMTQKATRSVRFPALKNLRLAWRVPLYLPSSANGLSHEASWGYRSVNRKRSSKP